jgi:hypothetical protein
VNDCEIHSNFGYASDVDVGEVIGIFCDHHLEATENEIDSNFGCVTAPDVGEAAIEIGFGEEDLLHPRFPVSLLAEKDVPQDDQT